TDRNWPCARQLSSRLSRDWHDLRRLREPRRPDRYPPEQVAADQRPAFPRTDRTAHLFASLSNRSSRAQRSSRAAAKTRNSAGSLGSSSGKSLIGPSLPCFAPRCSEDL